MSEFKFDMNEGALLIGDQTELAAERGVAPADIQDLAGLLLDLSIELTPEAYPYLDCDDWTQDDYQAHAKWLLSVVKTADSAITTPTDKVYERAFRLGLGPEPRRITRRFGPLWQFHDQLKLEGGYSRGKFEDWSTRDFIDYGRRVSVSMHRKKPTEQAFQRWFQRRWGPSPALIRDRIGGVGRLQELIGFPYIPDWTEDDYIDYGIKVALANPEVNLTRDVFDELSKRKRGPSTRSIVNHFDRLTKFKEIITQEAVLARQQRDDWLAAKVQERETLFERGHLPVELAERVDVQNKRLMVQQTAIFLLADNLLEDTQPQNRKIELSLMFPRNIIGAIRTKNPALSAGEIEARALELDLFDDIWPMEDYLEELKVTPKADGRRPQDSN